MRTFTDCCAEPLYGCAVGTNSETNFATYVGAKYGVDVNSATTAMHLAFLSLGIGPGDEVITVRFTFVATVAAILYTGAKAVLVYVDPLSWNMNPQLIEAAITPRARAIMPVDLHGCPADMASITGVASKHGIPVIEDAAQAHGAEISGRRCGTIGDSGCFSFYPGKNLGAHGERGMVFTNNDMHANKIRMLRDWGQVHKYIIEWKDYKAQYSGLN
jgi:dTDP-4-amino-4,6-dideoxygalactose transaminase